jgi:hypothetical protein
MRRAAELQCSTRTLCPQMLEWPTKILRGELNILVPLCCPSSAVCCGVVVCALSECVCVGCGSGLGVVGVGWNCGK